MIIIDDVIFHFFLIDFGTAEVNVEDDGQHVEADREGEINNRRAYLRVVGPHEDQNDRPHRGDEQPRKRAADCVLGDHFDREVVYHRVESDLVDVGADSYDQREEQQQDKAFSSLGEEDGGEQKADHSQVDEEVAEDDQVHVLEAVADGVEEHSDDDVPHEDGDRQERVHVKVSEFDLKIVQR